MSVTVNRLQTSPGDKSDKNFGRIQIRQINWSSTETVNRPVVIMYKEDANCIRAVVFGRAGPETKELRVPKNKPFYFSFHRCSNNLNKRRQAECERTPKAKFTHSSAEFSHSTGKRQSA